MKNRRLLVTGALTCAVAIPAVVSLANGAADPGNPVLPPAVASQLANSQASTKFVGPNARSFPGADGVTRVEGNGQVCSVAPDRVLACGPNKGLDQAPIVDVSIADGGKLAISFLTSTDVASINVTDSQGGLQTVGLGGGVGRATVPQGNFQFAWKTVDGKSHSDTVPVQKMFPPANAASVAAR